MFERRTSPFALTFSINPRWSRLNDTDGASQQTYAFAITILADTELIPDRLSAAFNVTYAPTLMRKAGSSKQDYPFELSPAIALAVTQDIFLGGELRHLTNNQDGFFSGHALFAGPTLFVLLSDTLAFKAAWSAQIPDETSGRIDLIIQERHQVRANWSKASKVHGVEMNVFCISISG